MLMTKRLNNKTTRCGGTLFVLIDQFLNFKAVKPFIVRIARAALSPGAGPSTYVSAGGAGPILSSNCSRAPGQLATHEPCRETCLPSFFQEWLADWALQSSWKEEQA